MKKYLLNYIPIITTLPAIIIGTIAMHMNNVPISIYIQNILCFLILGLSSYFLLKSKYRFYGTKSITVIITSIIALLFTFVNSGIEGVHRWISIGPIRMYVSVIVIPIIIISLRSLLRKGKLLITIISIICVSIILVLQPDASMITAFSIPSIILLWNEIKKTQWFLITLFLGGLTISTWIFLDGLAPVAYVEGILKLVLNMGILWFIIGISSLIIILIPFFIFPSKENKMLSICFGTYFAIILISNVFGNFPVPLMGYGVSTIIGYFISITWFTKTKINSLNKSVF